MRLRMIVAGLVLVGMVLVGSPAAAAGPSIQCGDTITTSIRLRANLVCAGDGLIVDASGITIDLGGFSVTGAGTGRGIGFAETSAPHHDVDIRRGTIANFATGIAFAFEDRDILIKDVRLVDNGTAHGFGQGGIVGSGIQNVEVRGGEIRGTGDAFVADAASRITLASVPITGGAISLFNGFGPLVVKGCTLTNSGILLSEILGAAITNNRLTDSVIDISQSDATLVRNNHLVRSTISYSSGRDGVIRGNRISGATFGVDFADSTGQSSVQIERNTFTGNVIGVRVVRDTLIEITDLTISFNTFRDNGAAGVLMQSAEAFLGPFAIERNLFLQNGFNSGGRTDSAGRPVDDGLHTDVPVGSRVVVANNTTVNNADFGIEALPDGSVVDGGGNTSSGNPSGCAGVVCR